MPTIDFTSYECTVLMNLLTDELELTAQDRDWQKSLMLCNLINRLNLYRIGIDTLDERANPPDLQ